MVLSLHKQPFVTAHFQFIKCTLLTSAKVLVTVKYFLD